jgi:hypothetical protein
MSRIVWRNKMEAMMDLRGKDRLDLKMYLIGKPSWN